MHAYLTINGKYCIWSVLSSLTGSRPVGRSIVVVAGGVAVFVAIGVETFVPISVEVCGVAVGVIVAVGVSVGVIVGVGVSAGVGVVIGVGVSVGVCVGGSIGGVSVGGAIGATVKQPNDSMSTGPGVKGPTSVAAAVSLSIRHNLLLSWR